MKDIIEQNRGLIKAIIKKLTGSYNEDIEQEVYIKTWRNMNHYKEQGKFSQWIGALTANVCRDYFKSRQYKIEAGQVGGDEILENVRVGGRQEEVLDAVSLGTLDMAVTSDDILAKYAPEWGYVGLPFLFDDVDDVDENLNGELGAYLSGKLEDKGMFVISFFENGFRNITANKEINTPQDLAGLKIRVMTNEPLRAMFTNAGAVVTNVSFSELYQALQLGTCEAEENPFANIRDKKFYEVQSYMCVTMHSHTAEPLVMSKELFDSLSAEDQAMFQEAGLEASKWAYQHAKDTDAENREYLEGQMTVIDPDRELWKEFAAETTASYEANYTEAAALKI